ncbi:MULTISPECIES: hypothetical protein [unclassified Wolbachia]|uniref:hypothetical protein n=1 Tax=unclassified Wolbachia TaxID=2640676 RepID=UPI00223006B3|nr:hypothetical protein [Wolbachia endosymbiont (group B) of Protocalliphora azurea]
MAPTNSTFFDTDYPELRKAISDIIESIAQSPQEEKGKLFGALSEQVRGMNLKDLGLAINDQGLQKEVNKELFIKFIEEALKNLEPEEIKPEMIEKVLQSVEREAISNVINNNKGPLDNLVNYFKSASTNEKIGMASAVMVLGAAFSPLIVLATLIALVAIGARYVGIGIGKAGEKIKEGAIDSGKAVKSLVKDVIDKLPTFQARKNNFSRLEINTNESLNNVTSKGQKDDKNKEYIKDFSDNIAILNMLQDQKKRSAIQELVENGTIKNFSKDDMTKLLKKGLSTHEEDMQKLPNLMKDFLPAIMASGNNEIEKVEEIVNKKVEEMKPYSQVENVSLKQGKEGKGKG